MPLAHHPPRSKEDITLDRLADADMVVFGGPREMFSTVEFKELKAYLTAGGRVMIFVGDGGEAGTGCNINYFIEE